MESTYPTVYGLWTNKGGVGKTTLTVHMASMYAKLHPNKKVLVVDMCPQCNASSTLLTHVDNFTISECSGAFKLPGIEDSVASLVSCMQSSTHGQCGSPVECYHYDYHLRCHEDQWIVVVASQYTGLG